MSEFIHRACRRNYLAIVFYCSILAVPQASFAADWKIIGSSEERELSIDAETVARDGTVVTYWDRYKSFKIGDKLDYAISQSKIDCARRLRRSVYTIEYYGNGTNAGAHTDLGWKPIAPGTVTDVYRRYLCED